MNMIKPRDFHQKKKKKMDMCRYIPKHTISGGSCIYSMSTKYFLSANYRVMSKIDKISTSELWGTKHHQVNKKGMPHATVP